LAKGRAGLVATRSASHREIYVPLHDTSTLFGVPKLARRRRKSRACSVAAAGSRDVMGIRVVVTGATGNVGTSVLRALSQDPAIEEIVGLARRRPQLTVARTRWVTADVARDDLVEPFRGADCVVHLAWLIQPSRDDVQLHAVNVDGSRRVFEAAARAGV
jgi:FlaA1/EpsC-like NDP-sugar epimerase